MMKCQRKNTKRHMFRSTHPSASETIPSDVPVTSVEPEDSVQTLSTRRITFKRPPNPLDRVEPPKRTRGDDDDHSAFLSAYHHDLEKVSENLKDGKSVFSGTGIPDMSDSAWLATKIKVETPKGATSTEAQSVERPQKDVDNLCNPDPETAFDVMVRRQRAEVKVSTLSAPNRNVSFVEAKDKETQHVCQIFCGRGGIASRVLTVCVDENALSCDVQGWWFIESTICGARFYGPKTWQDPNVFSNRIPSIPSDFPDTCRVTWFSNSQRIREMCISSGRFGRATS